ncbi:unnamed protein product [Caenorhabditis auriculariae]|uniref:Activin types I and II receptor domain-containing protein n=1 Tax=Caenorhabditis auriculariae TaxID=2777116 RepID=A0A8S1GWJ9_9PELO|nr:unnamed protein product [Caenorhabditis auriculariae]
MRGESSRGVADYVHLVINPFEAEKNASDKTRLLHFESTRESSGRTGGRSLTDSASLSPTRLALSLLPVDLPHYRRRFENGESSGRRHLFALSFHHVVANAMELTEVFVLAALLLACLSGSAAALRCKCTKESETVSCTDGVCETDVGSCLMLDHPTMGVHYTCHTRGMKNGSCHNRTSKSGVSVKICGCNGPDFCNYSMWPDKSAQSLQEQRRQQNEEEINSTRLISHISLLTFFTFLRYLL